MFACGYAAQVDRVALCIRPVLLGLFYRRLVRSVRHEVGPFDESFLLLDSLADDLCVVFIDVDEMSLLLAMATAAADDEEGDQAAGDQGKEKKSACAERNRKCSYEVNVFKTKALRSQTYAITMIFHVSNPGSAVVVGIEGGVTYPGGAGPDPVHTGEGRVLSESFVTFVDGVVVDS